MRARPLLLVAAALLVTVSVTASCSQPVSSDNTGESITGAGQSSLSPITLIAEPLYGSPSKLRDLSVATELPASGSVMVYKVRHPKVDKDNVREVAKRLGLGSAEVGETDDFLFARNASGDVHVDKVSGALYYDTPALDGSPRPLQDVRDEDYYRTEAEKFLKGTGLWREGAVFAGLSTETMTKTEGAGKEATYPLSVEVHFTSGALGGLPWAGVGPKISVFFGEGARVTGAAVYWPQVDEYKKYPTISGQQAIDNILAGKGGIMEADPAEDKGIIQQVEMVYWCDPVGYPQEFVAPYYRMRGVTAGGSDFTVYTRAIPEELITETRPPSPASAATVTPRTGD